MFGLCFYVSNLAMDILVFIVFYVMDSTLWFIVIAIWSTDHKVVLNLTWLDLTWQDTQNNGPIAHGEPFYKRSPKNKARYGRLVR